MSNKGAAQKPRKRDGKKKKHKQTQIQISLEATTKYSTLKLSRRTRKDRKGYPHGSLFILFSEVEACMSQSLAQKRASKVTCPSELL